MTGYVFIVDDDPAVLELRSLQLRSNGFNVVTAKGSEIALEMLGMMKRPRALLLDVSRGKQQAMSFLSQASQSIPWFSKTVPFVFVLNQDCPPPTL
jgi:CheY-like chemotaxis protein